MPSRAQNGCTLPAETVDQGMLVHLRGELLVFEQMNNSFFEETGARFQNGGDQFIHCRADKAQQQIDKRDADGDIEKSEIP